MIKTSLEFEIIFIIFGLLVGSFLNVVIYRIPLGKSVIKPRSSCPKCGHKIKWYENLPVISYLLLKGACKACKTKISIRYPLIELLCGVIAYLLIPSYLSLGNIFIFLYFFFLACSLLAHFLIDIEHQILPDKINLFLFFITLAYVFMNKSLNSWLLGGILGFILPYSITWLFYKIKGQIGLGGGDIKLFGVLGLLLGPIGIVQNMFFSCTLGALIGVILILSKKMKRNAAMAFGPFIIIAAVLQIFFPALFKYLNPFYI